MDDLRADLEALLDEPTAFLTDDRPELRRLAAATLAPRAGDAAVATALADVVASDDESSVRAAAAEALASSSDPVPLLSAAADPADEVREAVAFALGEIGDAAAIDWLIAAARNDSDVGTREAAVAALGAIGDDRIVPLLIDLASSAPPKVRRRAVVALSAFENDEASTAIRDALQDRNPMVKEVAEMVAGGQLDDLPFPTSPKAD